MKRLILISIRNFILCILIFTLIVIINTDIRFGSFPIVTMIVGYLLYSFPNVLFLDVLFLLTKDKIFISSIFCILEFIIYMFLYKMVTGFISFIPALRKSIWLDDLFIIIYIYLFMGGIIIILDKSLKKTDQRRGRPGDSLDQGTL